MWEGLAVALDVRRGGEGLLESLDGVAGVALLDEGHGAVDQLQAGVGRTLMSMSCRSC